MKTRNRAKKDLTKNGHDLVLVELDWSAWPAASASTSGRQVVGLTCRKCWIIFRGSCQNKSQCKASDGKVPYPEISLWDRLRANVNRPKLLRATETQADARFDAAAGSTRKLDFDPKGHDWHELYVAAVKYYSGKAPCKKKVKLYTCSCCRFLAKSVSGAGRVGLSRKASSKTVDKWALANIWDISVADAIAWHRANSQGWIRDLTHPGPHLHVVSINAGGLAGTWRAVEELISVGKVDVLGVQEVAASDSELLALRRAALKNGYRIFHVAGNPTCEGWGAVRQRGGVALFARLLFKIHPAISFVGLDSQCVGVWLDGWFLATAYAPPGYNDEPVLELASGTSFFSTLVWLVFGDFNELVGASKLEIALSAFGGAAVSVDKPTRWEGQRCVDWALTSRPLTCDQPELLDVALSDHIPVSLVLASSPNSGRSELALAFSQP